MLLARVPVPWGSEPKAQTVYALTKGTRWYNDSEDRIQVRGEPDSDVDIDTIQQKLFVTPSPRPKSLSQEIAPVLLKWAVLKGGLRKVAPPADTKLQVFSFPRGETSWVEQMPPSLLDWATDRPIKRSPRPEKLIPFDPFSTRTKVFAVDEDSQEWVEQLPPSLLAWAVSRGIKKLPAEQLIRLDPYKARSKVVSLDQRRQIYAALRRGEWCLADEVDVFPPTLKRWLIECRVKFIRYVGGGRIAPTGTPVNGYVTEDGVVFYVAEDGATFYVQET